MSRGSVSIDVRTEGSIDVRCKMSVDGRRVSSVDGGERVSVDEEILPLRIGRSKLAGSVENSTWVSLLLLVLLGMYLKRQEKFYVRKWFLRRKPKLNKIKSIRWSKLPGRRPRMPVCTYLFLHSIYCKSIKKKRKTRKKKEIGRNDSFAIDRWDLVDIVRQNNIRNDQYTLQCAYQHWRSGISFSSLHIVLMINVLTKLWLDTHWGQCNLSLLGGLVILTYLWIL